MSNKIMKLDTPELEVIEKSKADKIKSTFEPMVQMLTEFEDMYNSIIKDSEKEITLEVTSKAKRLRLDIGKVRIETGKLKDKQKEYIKLEDKAIMGIHNLLVWAVKEKEDKLKEIEDYFEIQEQKRIEALQSERVELLSPYLADAHERNLSGMDSDVWSAYFEAKKKEHFDMIAAEKKAEEERIAKEKAELAEAERIRKENAKLKAQAEEQAKKAKIEAEKRAKIEAERIAKENAERKEREEKARKEREAYEAKLKAQAEEKERIEHEERIKREKLEAELQAKKDAEIKAKTEAEAKLQAELNKGDSAKLNDLVSDLKAIKSKYSFKSDKNKKMYSDVGLLIDKVINHITK